MTASGATSTLRMTAVAATVLGLTLGAPAAEAAAQTRSLLLTEVVPVEGIQVPHGTPSAEMLERLPPRTTIELSNGTSREVELDWFVSPHVATSRGGNFVRQVYDPTIRGVYEVSGAFTLPDRVRRPDPAEPPLVRTQVVVGGGPMIVLDDRDTFDQPGTYESRTMTFGEVERTYHLYIPTTYSAGAPVPVMFTFHGAGSHGVGQLAYTRFDQVAEREGFIVIAPDYGLSALGTFMTPGVADFSAAILDEVGAEYALDPERIYASGISMGGGASVTLAHELGDRIAAVAPVATGIGAVMDLELPMPTTFVYFYGNRDSGYGPAIYDRVGWLVEQNGASPSPEVTTWPRSEHDPTTVTRFWYHGEPGGADVIFYRVEEGGHTWPGRYQYASLISVGNTAQHFNATEVIWDHLSQHTLPVGDR